MTKLTRIWKPSSKLELPWHGGERYEFRFQCLYFGTSYVTFHILEQNYRPAYVSLEGIEQELHWLQNDNDEGGHIWSPLNKEGMLYSSKEGDLFAGRYMALFRRNCWLSGCSLECTAHEQIEWQAWFQEQE